MTLHAPAALETRTLSRRLGGHLVLSRLDLVMLPGCVYALMGRNGAGKTTLLQCLSGQLRPSSGELYWFGQSPWRNLALRRWVGLVFHETGLYPELTARENLLFAARMYQLSDAASHVDRCLNEARLEQYADWPACRLSKGTRQRLALIRSWLHEPRLLLLDEPFTALDEAGHEWLTGRLRMAQSAGATILFSCHDRALAERLADHVLQLDRGRLAVASRADSRRTETRERSGGCTVGVEMARDSRRRAA